jgi:DNA-binding Lrp family transcriptional regulator
MSEKRIVAWNEETRKAQGDKQRRDFNTHNSRVFMAIAKKPSSLRELRETTHLSQGAVWKHLKWLEQAQFIYRDTVKPNEEFGEVGKVVWKARPPDSDYYRGYFREAIKTALGFIDLNFETQENKRKMEIETEKFIDVVEKIILDEIERSTNRVLAKLKKSQAPQF